MATPAPLPRTLQPPPELPNDPKTSDVLSNYLRTFSLWCRHGFADKLSVRRLRPRDLLLQATDDPTKIFYGCRSMQRGRSHGDVRVPLGGGRP